MHNGPPTPTIDEALARLRTVAAALETLKQIGARLQELSERDPAAAERFLVRLARLAETEFASFPASQMSSASSPAAH